MNLCFGKLLSWWQLLHWSLRRFRLLAHTVGQNIDVALLAPLDDPLQGQLFILHNIIVNYSKIVKLMLPSITPEPFGRTAFSTENKIKYKKASDAETWNPLYHKTSTHSSFKTDKPSGLIRYAKVESKMYQTTLTQEIKEIDRKIR